MRMALRRLRRFARTGAAEELDLDNTIRETAEKGYLEVKLRPERHNAVKVLLFLDVGGSMDWHVEAAEELFSAARLEFKHFAHFYFHNCPYERLWTENRRRFEETLAAIREGISGGIFPAVSGEEDERFGGFINCHYCDFDRICSRRRDFELQEKQDDPAFAVWRRIGEVARGQA